MEGAQSLAALQHGPRERLGLSTVQSPEEDGHEECRHLVVRDVATQVLVRQLLPLVRRDTPAVALPGDQRTCEHGRCRLMRAECCGDAVNQSKGGPRPRLAPARKGGDVLALRVPCTADENSSPRPRALPGRPPICRYAPPPPTCRHRPPPADATTPRPASAPGPRSTRRGSQRSVACRTYHGWRPCT